MTITDGVVEVSAPLFIIGDLLKTSVVGLKARTQDLESALMHGFLFSLYYSNSQIKLLYGLS